VLFHALVLTIWCSTRTPPNVCVQQEKLEPTESAGNVVQIISLMSLVSLTAKLVPKDLEQKASMDRRDAFLNVQQERRELEAACSKMIRLLARHVVLELLNHNLVLMHAISVLLASTSPKQERLDALCAQTARRLKLLDQFLPSTARVR
jgi:hypothetical protein